MNNNDVNSSIDNDYNGQMASNFDAIKSRDPPPSLDVTQITTLCNDDAAN